MGRARTEIENGLVRHAEEGEVLEFANVRGRLAIDGKDAGDRFAVAVFPHIPPRVLAAPLHRHHHEDEFTYVLDGSLGVQIGDEVATATAGTWILKPRMRWHTFWNPGDAPCRTVEIVSPAGFQRYFRELAAVGADLEQLARLNAKYGIDMDFDSVPTLCGRFGLSFPIAGM